MLADFIYKLADRCRRCSVSSSLSSRCRRSGHVTGACVWSVPREHAALSEWAQRAAVINIYTSLACSRLDNAAATRLATTANKYVSPKAATVAGKMLRALLALVYMAMSVQTRERALLEIVLYEPNEFGEYATTLQYQLLGLFSTAGARTSAEGQIMQVRLPTVFCEIL